MNIHEWFDDDSHEKCQAYTDWIDKMIDEGDAGDDACTLL